MPVTGHALMLMIAGLVHEAPVAAADEPAATPARPVDRVSLWVGGLRTHSDTTFRVRAGSGDYSAAGRVSLESDLGLDQRQPVTHIRLDVLIGEAQGLSLEHFAYRRSASRELARELVFQGQTYLAAARLQARFEYDFGSVAHRWWFGEGATAYGLGLGLAYYRVQSLLVGEASLDGNRVERVSHSSDHAIAPLLALGWRHALGDDLRVYVDLSGVAKGGSGLAGHVVDAAVGLEWFPFRRLGIAAEYGATTIRLDRARNGLDARLELVLQGPSLFMRLR